MWGFWVMPDLASKDTLKDAFKVQAEKAAVLNSAERDRMEAGFKSGSTDGVIKTSAAAAKDVQDSVNDKAEKAAKERASDVIFLALLDELNTIDREIDFRQEQAGLLSDTLQGLQSGDIDMMDALQEEHVQRAIREWEARTGQIFDPNDENAEAQLSQIIEQQRAIDLGHVQDLQARRADVVDRIEVLHEQGATYVTHQVEVDGINERQFGADLLGSDNEVSVDICLLYTSDAATTRRV